MQLNKAILDSLFSNSDSHRLVDSLFNFNTLNIVIIAGVTYLVCRNSYFLIDKFFGDGSYSWLFGRSREELILEDTFRQIIDIRNSLSEVIKATSADLLIKHQLIDELSKKINIILTNFPLISRELSDSIKRLDEEIKQCKIKILHLENSGVREVTDSFGESVTTMNRSTVSNATDSLIVNIESQLNNISQTQVSNHTQNEFKYTSLYDSLSHLTKTSDIHLPKYQPGTFNTGLSKIAAGVGDFAGQITPYMGTTSFYLTVGSCIYSGVKFLMQNPEVVKYIWEKFLHKASVSDRILDSLKGFLR